MGLHTPPHMPKILRTCYQWHIQSFLQRDLILKDAASSIEGITQSNINYLRKRKSEYSCDLLHSKMNENIFVDSFFFHLDLFVSWFFFSACIFVFSAISNFFFFNWDSLHARLNSHYEAWSYKKRSTKKDYRIQKICLERT